MRAPPVVEAMDPDIVVTVTGNEHLAPIVIDARARLSDALDALQPAHQQG